MSMEYKTYITQLRDGVAMRIQPILVSLAVSQVVDDYTAEESASDAWDYAEAFVAEREKRYGPPPAEKLEYVVWGKPAGAWMAQEGTTSNLNEAMVISKETADTLKGKENIEVFHIDEARANER